MDFKFSEILFSQLGPGLWHAFEILLPFMVIMILFKIIVNKLFKK